MIASVDESRGPDEQGIRELRANLPAVVRAAEAGQVTYVTYHGRRVAAVVPVELPGEATEKPQQRKRGAQSAA
jgi:prevent-host-death family protein